MKTETVYEIYDPRYRTNPDRATLFTVEETLKDAERVAPEYGDNNVIVETKLRVTGSSSREFVSSKIIN